MKWEMNADSPPKAYCHAVWMESCYTVTPAAFSIFAAQPHNCGCTAHQALYTCGTGKTWLYIIPMCASVYTTQRHTSHYLYCNHNLQSIFCKQLKISTFQTENDIYQSVPLPTLTRLCSYIHAIQLQFGKCGTRYLFPFSLQKLFHQKTLMNACDMWMIKTKIIKKPHNGGLISNYDL